MTPDEAKDWCSQAGLKLRYGADLARLHGAGAPFTQLRLDQETADYVAQSEAARHGRFLTWVHQLLRSFLSDFDINGILGTYPMHVLSTAQWETLIGRPGGRLLDVGAGRGDATAKLAQLFDEIVVTETSKAMQKRLRRQGYECLSEDIAESKDLAEQFDAVSLLNVLDRCDRPLSLLGTARSALKPGGLLLIALVLPYRPFVYDQGAPRAPAERLAITTEEWELSVCELVNTCLLPLGLEVVTLSRAPYLSGGDANHALYELDDVIVVCRAIGQVPLINPGPT